MSEPILSSVWNCTFDLDNNQQSYAQCLETVTWLEQVGKGGLVFDNQTESDFFPFYISRSSGGKISSKPVLLWQEQLIASGDQKKCARLTSREMLLNGITREKKKHRFEYYFRVHLSPKEDDVTDLQYLVLLLQSIPEIRNRIAIRIMDNGTYSWQTKDYFRVSHFLRFIQREYDCFYACFKEAPDSLSKLTRDAAGTQSTFLPLLQVDSQLCQTLNKTWLLTAKYSGQNYSKLYTALEPKGCDQNSITWMLFQIGARILFLNQPGTTYKKRESKEQLLDFLCDLIQEVQGITPLDMLLFSVLIGDKLAGGPDHDTVKECLGRVQMLSQAIGQILENIVNHSERNTGVFTFRRQRNEEYLKIRYPDYEFTAEKDCLELMIADSNRRDGIVDHFLNSGKADTSLKDHADDVRLAQLFGDYPEGTIREIWEKAHRNRPEMCHGLRSFAASIRNLKGAVWARSGPRFTSETDRDIYYDCGLERDAGYKPFLDRTYIPGTQFSIIIDGHAIKYLPSATGSQSEGEFDLHHLVYTTTYRELAQALCFEENIRELAIDGQMMDSIWTMSTQEKKDAAVSEWKEWFDNQAETSDMERCLVYQCDLDAFCQKIEKNPEIGEPFCKGFLSSRFFVHPNKNIYYAIIFQSPSALFSRLFASTLRVMLDQNVFDTERVCVYFYLKQYKSGHLPYCADTLHNLIERFSDSGRPLNPDIFPRIFPYSLFRGSQAADTPFEQELRAQAGTPISSRDNQGFKISETHMRLGNKVHLDTFYEMALFFENPNYAYYTAFLFLRTFLEEHRDILLQKQHLIFYGYASYSRAVIWAILRIFDEYMHLNGITTFPETAFVIYQNDLKIESDQPQIQMYYSRAEWQCSPETIWSPENTALVLVVPISSSMTTFNKMKAELRRETKNEFTTIENFTAFWVRNNYEDERRATEVESEFWQAMDPVQRTIKSNIVQGEIRYLVSATSEWSNPLSCQRCFPPTPLMEYPLVETDPTSTIPTQQYYCQPPAALPAQQENPENDRRVSRLRDSMLYGHISKGHNHYQYYIKTRDYFLSESAGVAIWLKGLRDQVMGDEDKEAAKIFSPDCINVLIIPQQVDNVEFSQYVYEYYFHGNAESVIINTEKEFRSNLKAEYSGLFHRLRASRADNKQIRFHYIDISIRSGTSFNRAVSLVSSCIKEGADTRDLSAAFQIDKVFLLLSRLSEDSKRAYVREPEKNYHAYVELHISAMRTFGDSCVPCKLQQEAMQYYKRAATKSISEYWEQKVYDRECVSFDQFDISNSEKQDRKYALREEGYRRMICSHRAAYFIGQVRGREIDDYFSAVRSFFSELLSGSARQDGIYAEICKENCGDWLAAGLKVLARPFFSFDYKMRCVVMDLYLILSEYLIKKYTVEQLRERIERETEASSKAYLLKNENLEWILSFADVLAAAIDGDLFDLLEFVRDNILKSLTDIKSNYILRKDTILQISQRLSEARGNNDKNDGRVSDYYAHYLRSILRMTHSSSDETKGVWLEFLLQYGDEFQDVSKGESDGIDRLVQKVPSNIQSQFRYFLELLLVENNRPVYQAVVEFDKQLNQNGESPDNRGKSAEEFLKEYHMRNAKSFLSFGYNTGTEKQLDALRSLLCLEQETPDYIGRYQTLGDQIQRIVKLETSQSGDVTLFGKMTENLSPVNNYLNVPKYFVLFPTSGENYWEKTPVRKRFEDQMEKVETDSEIEGYLSKSGFFLAETEGKAKRFDIIIKLDNNYAALEDYPQQASIQKIEPIFMYISCRLCRQQALGLTRKILMFRRKLIEWLEKDFNNNAIAVLSQRQYIAQILSTDKMGDHAEDDFVECQQKLLMATEEKEFQKGLEAHIWDFAVNDAGQPEGLYELDENSEPPLEGSLEAAREWFFLRSYINSRISRLFRTMVRREQNSRDIQPIDMETFYALRGQPMAMRSARDLKTVFFTPIKPGYIRKNYLRQMLSAVTFSVNGKPDYGTNLDAGIDERLERLSAQLEQFCCVTLVSANSGLEYTYLSEYMAVILLDCIVSGIKAGEVWNVCSWGGEAYRKLESSRASDKCLIRLSRETGGEFAGKPYDYLVIQNEVFHPLRSPRKGPGMSQAAIRWYIEGLWRCVDSGGYPEVIANKKENEYIVKLPILERNGGVL